ncbi:hypothetical protein BG011_008033 [Mortierella polycephala]|uniref:Uncharacterized protein n=1 Tax=Mortierella polycephala TaxID=41804 RepID=A0A9P6PQH2_9FUNG|nr:hypothetical protein BG011_008033 [Mortierella polycephala]
MNIHIPTAWMKITIVRTATRTVGGNLTKKETFGLWDGHEFEIVVDPTSPSSVLRYASITGFEVGHEIKVKGELRIKELKLSLIVQQMNCANIGDKESAPEEEEYNSKIRRIRFQQVFQFQTTEIKVTYTITLKHIWKAGIKSLCAIAFKHARKAEIKSPCAITFKIPYTIALKHA